MQSMYEHRLDTSLDLSRKIDSLSVREQLMLRTAPPPVTPRLSESLLSQAHQASLRQAVQNPYLDVSSAESYLIVDANHAIKKLNRWRELMPRVKPFFAIKCNPDPILIKSLVVAGDCGFDCASLGEISAVLEAGAHPNRIIYANPNKAPDAIVRALSLGVTTMTFDSIAELQKVSTALHPVSSALSPSRRSLPSPDMVLRLRVPDDHSVFKLGSKFGAEPIQIRSLLQAAIDIGLKVVGISFHCGSGCYDANAFVIALRLAKQAFDIGAELGITMTLLDMGGGFPGLDGEEEVTDDEFEEPAETSEPVTLFNLPSAPYVEHVTLRRNMAKFKDELHLIQVADAVNPALAELFPIDGPPVAVISEPGRYFVEGSSELFLKVFEKSDIALGDSVPEGAADDTALTATEPTTLWFVNEGTLGCFKDIVLSDVKFEPELVSHADVESLPETATLTPAATPNTNRSRSNTVNSESDTRPRGLSEASSPYFPSAAGYIDSLQELPEEGVSVYDGIRRHVLVGVEGSAMTVLHERLPFEPHEGCWVRYKRFGAYTNSLASNDISEAKARKHYYWCRN